MDAPRIRPNSVCNSDEPISTACLKRKRPDDEGTSTRSGPLTEDPIENEYEHFDEDEDADDEIATQLKKNEFEEIVRAQEPSTLQQYDDIKITPFNLEEELEEGNFDKAGNFIFSKKQKDTDENPNDNWAETVDWDSVEQKERERKRTQMVDHNEAAMEEKMPQVRDKHACYREMLGLMLPNENVQQTIRRLGNSMPKRQPKHKSKQPAFKSNQQEANIDIKETRRKLEQMIDLAHQILESGDVDIYQKSFQDVEKASVLQT